MNAYNKIVGKVQDLTNQKLYAINQTVLSESLRQLKHIFSNIYYLDMNNQKIKVHCTTGKVDRVAGKKDFENSLVLPYISVNEVGVSMSDERRRTSNLLISKVLWDTKELRAKRIVSLPPIAVDVSYEVNIWAKYASDLDTLRISIFSLFNPDLTVRTKFSDLNRAFIESESDITDYTADDTSDRTLKKSIRIKLETYYPAPEFLLTNTGEIVSFNTQVEVFSQSADMEIDDPEETITSSDNLSYVSGT